MNVRLRQQLLVGSAVAACYSAIFAIAAAAVAVAAVAADALAAAAVALAVIAGAAAHSCLRRHGPHQSFAFSSSSELL